MTAILTQNKLNVFSGGIDTASGGGTATVISATTLLAYSVTFTAVAANEPVFIGGTAATTISTAGSEQGLLIAAQSSVTLTAFSAESLGFRGARRGEMFLDLAEMFVDGTSNGFRLTWFGFGPGVE